MLGCALRKCLVLAVAHAVPELDRPQGKPFLAEKPQIDPPQEPILGIENLPEGLALFLQLRTPDLQRRTAVTGLLARSGHLRHQKPDHHDQGQDQSRGLTRLQRYSKREQDNIHHDRTSFCIILCFDHCIGYSDSDYSIAQPKRIAITIFTGFYNLFTNQKYSFFTKQNTSEN